jgi:hypothetical protein
MNCERCDRDNVVMAYCYYKQREIAYTELVERPFTYRSFAEFAVEHELIWKWSVTCPKLTRAKAKFIFDQLKPYLVEALQKSKSSGGRTSDVKF